MPTYSYQCRKCGEEFDVFHGMTESPKVKCVSCGSLRCDRLIGTGAGVIFKGSGFYETDFKEKKGKAHSETASKAGTGESAKSEAAEAKSVKPETPKKEAAKPDSAKPSKSSKAKE